MICNYLVNMLQFRAIADQLFRNPDYHKHVRKQVIKQVWLLIVCIYFFPYVSTSP